MIRLVKLEDVEILNNICQNNKALSSTIQDDNYINWFISHINNKSMFYVYEIENNIVGFILCERMIGDGLLLWLCCVIKEYQNLGIASDLFEYVEEIAKKENIKWLITYGYVDNIYVDKLLKSFNFETNNNIYKEYIKNI